MPLPDNMTQLLHAIGSANGHPNPAEWVAQVEGHFDAMNTAPTPEAIPTPSEAPIATEAPAAEQQPAAPTDPTFA